jgi:phosphatidylglycerophosphate synthase
MHTVEASRPPSGMGRPALLDVGRGRRWLPWSLSLLRLLLGPLYVLALEVSATLPLSIAVLAVLSDFVDGRIARRLGVASRAGAVLDVLGDGVFVVVTLAALASLRIVTWFLPVAVVLALTGLTISSLRSGAAADPAPPVPPRARGPADRAGHAAGIVNYGAVLAASAAVAGLIPGAWILPASVAVAVLNVSPLALRLAHGRRSVR